jgi:hypothetical protein
MRLSTGSAAHLCSRPRLVAQWASHQSSNGLQSWTRKNLGLWGVAGPRWQGVDQASAASRNSKGYIASLTDIEVDNPTGDIFIIDFSPEQSQQSGDPHVAGGASAHPSRLHSHGGTALLNLQEGWWRLFRRDALAGQSFANPTEIEQATRVATAQLNLRAKPWVWGRPAKTPRYRRRLFSYRL